jgi:putative ABC transport system substrate-binding protein
MRRRKFIAIVGGAAATWPLAARAQQPSIPVIGYLGSGSPDSEVARLIGLRRGLTEAGYIEGQNLIIEYRWAGDRVDLLPALAAELIKDRVAVIIAPGLPSALAAKAATQTVPIVFGVGIDPVQLGLVARFDRPGGNLTGTVGLVVTAKQLEILHELLPATPSVGLLENPRNHPIAEMETRDALTAARAIGLQIQILHATSEGEIDEAFASLARARTGALLVTSDFLFNNRMTQLVALAARYAIPTLYTGRDFPLAGGLMSYGGGLAELYRLTGLHAARILKGEKPADLPVMQMTKIELVINLKTANVLGITIPPTLLARADWLIE